MNPSAPTHITANCRDMRNTHSRLQICLHCNRRCKSHDTTTHRHTSSGSASGGGSGPVQGGGHTPDGVRQHKIDVWNETHAAVRNGYYTVGGSRIPIHPGGTPTIRSSLHAIHGPQPAIISVSNMDCLLAAEGCVRRGLKTAVLDCGSENHFGGGYKTGACAQEENLCRRTTLALQADPSLNGGINVYPLGTSCALVPGVQVLRGPAPEYGWLQVLFRVDILIVAAVNKGKSGGHFTTADIEHTRSIIFNLLATAAQQGTQALVLTALGCGAFANPPEVVAGIFAKVLQQFRGCFEEVIFAIVDDHNTGRSHNPNGNFAVFHKALDGRDFAKGESVVCRGGGGKVELKPTFGKVESGRPTFEKVEIPVPLDVSIARSIGLETRTTTMDTFSQNALLELFSRFGAAVTTDQQAYTRQANPQTVADQQAVATSTLQVTADAVQQAVANSTPQTVADQQLEEIDAALTSAPALAPAVERTDPAWDHNWKPCENISWEDFQKGFLLSEIGQLKTVPAFIVKQSLLLKRQRRIAATVTGGGVKAVAPANGITPSNDAALANGGAAVAPSNAAAPANGGAAVAPANGITPSNDAAPANGITPTNAATGGGAANAVAPASVAKAAGGDEVLLQATKALDATTELLKKTEARAAAAEAKVKEAEEQKAAAEAKAATALTEVDTLKQALSQTMLLIQNLTTKVSSLEQENVKLKTAVREFEQVMSQDS